MTVSHERMSPVLTEKSYVSRKNTKQWRDFFRIADADIWTIILHAINLAAHDFPEEFNQRKAQIAETLFDNNFSRFGDSVELIEETLLEEGELEHDHDGCDEKKRTTLWSHRNGDHATGTLEHESRDLKSEKNVTGADPLAGAFRDGLQSRGCLFKEIEHIKHFIDSHNQLENKVVYSLQRLQNMDITVDILKVTEIGKYVNCLRKHPSNQVRAIVKQLISSDWKNLVDEWVSCAGGEEAALAATKASGWMNENSAVSKVYLSVSSSSGMESILPEFSDKRSASYMQPLLTPEENWSTVIKQTGSSVSEVALNVVRPGGHSNDMAKGGVVSNLDHIRSSMSKKPALMQHTIDFDWSHSTMKLSAPVGNNPLDLKLENARKKLRRGYEQAENVRR